MELNLRGMPSKKHLKFQRYQKNHKRDKSYSLVFVSIAHTCQDENSYRHLIVVALKVLGCLIEEKGHL